MGYVYRYTDLSDNIIKYVGIVWSKNRTLLQRIKEHEAQDEWCKNKNWKIEYIETPINTRTDAEYMEAHFISYFGTNKYFNRAKSGWGISSFIEKRDNWQLFDIEKEQKLNDLEIENVILQNKVEHLSKQLEEFKKMREQSKTASTEVNYLKDRVKELERQIDVFADINRTLHNNCSQKEAIKNNTFEKNQNRNKPKWVETKSLSYISESIKENGEIVRGRNRFFYSRRNSSNKRVSIPCKMILYKNGRKTECKHFNSVKECSECSGLSSDQIIKSMGCYRNNTFWTWRKNDELEYLSSLYFDEKINDFDVVIKVCAITPITERGRENFEFGNGIF